MENGGKWWKMVENGEKSMGFLCFFFTDGLILVGSMI